MIPLGLVFVHMELEDEDDKWGEHRNAIPLIKALGFLAEPV